MINQVQSALNEARKNKLNDKVVILSSLLAKLKFAQKENNTDYLSVISKYLKTINETKEIAVQNNRKDIIEQCINEINIISQFMPKQLSESELRKIIINYINENNIDTTDKKCIGIIIKFLKEKYNGQYDGKSANQIICSI